MTNGNGTPPRGSPSPPAQRAGAVHQGSVVRKIRTLRPRWDRRRSRLRSISRSTSTPTMSAKNEYEVALLIEGKAENGGKVMFSFDLSYAGVFRIMNVPKETCTR